MNEQELASASDEVFHIVNTLKALVDGVGITQEKVDKLLAAADRMELEIPYFTPKDSAKGEKSLHHIRTRLNLVKHALTVIEAERKINPSEMIDLTKCERDMTLYYDHTDWRDHYAVVQPRRGVGNG